MKILIVGGDGMLGHELLRFLSSEDEVWVTLRRELAAYRELGLFDENNAYGSVDVRVVDRLHEVIADCQPQVIVNAVGIVKQRELSRAYIPSLEVNSLFPHRLAVIAKLVGARFIHFSTDCVFSGTKGDYRETDFPDAGDLYGRSKYLGEVAESHCLTLRTSIVGKELSRRTSLVEWFLAQSGEIKGFRRAIYSGFTTTEMSRIVNLLIHHWPRAAGIYHVSSDPISKYELLMLIKHAGKLAIDIVPDDDFICDRSLNSDRFRSEFGYNPPKWETMVEEMMMLRSV